jgi:hypothetical protein
MRMKIIQQKTMETMETRRMETTKMAIKRTKRMKAGPTISSMKATKLK